MNRQLSPTTDRQRYVVLDALRGLALLGICLANFPEFGLWTFLDADSQAAMPTAAADGVVRFLQYVVVDAKFYGIFSMLFGIGFSIILSHAQERGSSGIALFYRRMGVLLLIAVAHLLLLWSGDILVLYALTGMLLPLLCRLSDRMLVGIAVGCIALPVGLDCWQEMGGFRLSAAVEAAWWRCAGTYGIDEGNFATWLRDCHSYVGVHQFLMQGAVERLYEFVDGHRLLKVLGLFLMGYVMGRNRLYARLPDRRRQLCRVCGWGLAVGLPTSVLYAVSATQSHRWGLTVHSLLYTVSALPMSLAYMAGFALLWLRWQRGVVFRALAQPGRMALSNYIGQSCMGILIYYGIGMGMGLTQGLWQIECTAVGVFLLQVAVSALWMRRFRYGPLEWVWRMLTYGRRLPLTKRAAT
ncbi:MAG: DUF418 domain-containing protein [Prevotellaceae bacterium]|nr:DUF418 domain-containing protein [Prevotellaceae bacterium]